MRTYQRTIDAPSSDSREESSPEASDEPLHAVIRTADGLRHRGSRSCQVHPLHHTPTEMNVWTGMVVHPVEALLVLALPVLANGPEAQTLHHSVRLGERNADSADCLTLWERLFGTYRKATSEVFRGPCGPGS